MVIPVTLNCPSLNAANRKEQGTLEFQHVLAALTLRVEGPFPASESHS